MTSSSPSRPPAGAGGAGGGPKAAGLPCPDEEALGVSAPLRPPRPCGRAPARVFADAELLEAIRGDRSLEQLVNVATLPGIVEAALAMPDIHQGYGFPVGGLAATALPDGVVSPGGVGYDINCGVRLLA